MTSKEFKLNLVLLGFALDSFGRYLRGNITINLMGTRIYVDRIINNHVVTYPQRNRTAAIKFIKNMGN